MTLRAEEERGDDCLNHHGPPVTDMMMTDRKIPKLMPIKRAVGSIYSTSFIAFNSIFSVGFLTIIPCTAGRFLASMICPLYSKAG